MINNKMAQNTSTTTATKQQHLFELLKEDQEPFFLKDYIADRRVQMKNGNSTKTLDLHTKKRPTEPKRPIVSHKKVPCFCSSTSSPNVKRSPLFEFPSPMTIKKSPTKSNPILLHIPARTAALLLEAASRIQNQSSKPKPKPKATKLGLFGSLLKRLSSHHRTSNNNNKKTKEIACLANPNPDGLSQTVVKDKFDGTSCSTGVWSESNCGDKCLDSAETSSSGVGQSEETAVDFVAKLMLLSHSNDLDHDQDFGFCDENEFCDQSPFRFVLQKSPSLSSSGRRTPDFSSPASSPVRRRGVLQGKENYVAENSNVLFQQEEEEEEKEQFSPVSVLDPPFEDDYDISHECDEDEDEDEDEEDSVHQDAFDMESSYAIVQRTKQQLLRKLRRFERLAELDPIELEKRMLEGDNDDDDEELDEESEYCESNSPDREEASDLNGFVLEILSESTEQNPRAPGDMKRLVSDLIVEEKREYQNRIDAKEEAIVKGVVKRFESWKEVQSNTIDMMIEQDFRKELQGMWRNNNKEQIGEAVIELELEIFGLLVEELALELVAVCEN